MHKKITIKLVLFTKTYIFAAKIWELYQLLSYISF